MRRQLDRQDSDIAIQGYLPGCIWSIMHILDYHYWHSSKRISSRKHKRGKHTISFGYPKTVSFEHYADEVHEYLDSDAVPLMTEQETMNIDPTNRISGKDRVKAAVAKETSARSQMQLADLISHSRTSDNLGGTTNYWSNPIIIVEKNADTDASRLLAPSLQKSPRPFLSDSDNNLVNQNFSDAKKLTREISRRQIMECVDVLEIFKINKKLFLDILQDPDVKAAKNIDVQLTSDMKVKLKKSGSFPLATSADKQHLRPSTLERKWSETWSFGKGEKYNTEVELPRYITSKSLEDYHNETRENEADDAGLLTVTQESSFSSPPLSQGSHKHGWHLPFISHLKGIMKKIKHTLKDSKRQNNRKSCDEMSSSDKDMNKDRVSHMRRVSSLNESMDRYTRLFEYSLTRDTNWFDYKSKSLKLASEDNVPSTSHRIRSFKRRLSLPDHLDSYEPSHDALHPEIPAKNSMDLDTNTKNQIDEEQIKWIDAVEEGELDKNMEENTYQDQEISSMKNLSIEHEEQSHVSVFETRIEDVPVSEGSRLDNRHISIDEVKPSVDLDHENDADFNYVRDVLEVSGLIQQGYLGSWHSLDQPLSPTLFKELEDYLHHEMEDVECNSDHQLLFNLINEVLLQIYESSLDYFPKPFSFTQRTRPLPKGNRILDQVWKRIEGLKPRADNMLDDIVARDLSTDDGWMNLRLDAEDIALDLEDLIFAELVEEVICF